MRKAVAIFPAWLFYVLGDISSRLCNHIPDRASGPWARVGMGLARLYQWSMIKSLKCDDWGGVGIWEKPE